MLRQEAGAFARAADDVCCVEYLKLEIQLKDDEPVQKNYSSIPKPLYGEVKEYLEDLINGFIYGTVRPIYRPAELQRVVDNKR